MTAPHPEDIQEAAAAAAVAAPGVAALHSSPRSPTGWLSQPPAP